MVDMSDYDDDDADDDDDDGGGGSRYSWLYVVVLAVSSDVDNQCRGTLCVPKVFVQTHECSSTLPQCTIFVDFNQVNSW